MMVPLALVVVKVAMMVMMEGEEDDGGDYKGR